MFCMSYLCLQCLGSLRKRSVKDGRDLNDSKAAAGDDNNDGDS